MYPSAPSVGLDVGRSLLRPDLRAAALALLLPALIPAQSPQIVVPFGSTWRYLDTGTETVGWQLPGFDDSGWATGPAQLGYGEGDEATVVQSGPAGAYRLATWFRHAFTLGPGTLVSPRLRLVCDDGVVVWLNGVEVGRWNVHNGPVGALSPATLAVSGTAEAEHRVFALPPALLLPGANVLAVQMHQVSATSSDLSFDLELVDGAGPVTVLRGPYLQGATPSGLTVCWRTDQPVASQLWLGPTAAALQPAYFDATLRTDHAAVLTGLPPESLHYYRIGDASGPFTTVPAATLRTLPPPGAVRPFRIWAFGDAGIGWLTQHLVREAFALHTGGQPVDMLLFLGDNAYPIGTDIEYQNGVFDVYAATLRHTCSWSTLGNHDAPSASTPTQTGVYYDVFHHPRNAEAGGVPSGTEAYYSFDRGHVHFVCLDSMDSDRSPTGPMLTWLQADLQATTARWVIAFFHHPPYSAGSHHSDDPLDSGGRLFDMRQVVLPVLEAHGVDLVLCGHSHGYERSFLLDGHHGVSSTLQPSMLRDRGDGDDGVGGDGRYSKPTAGRAPHEGAVHVVAGSAGSLGGGPMNHPVMHRSLLSLGSLYIDIDGDRLDGAFVGLFGIEDRFTITKGETRTLVRDQPRLSVAVGGRQDLHLDGGAGLAGAFYMLAGSFGSTPGLALGGLHVPLNPDAWLSLSLALANSAVYPGSFGWLDAAGRATAAFVVPPASASLAGLVIHHAFVAAQPGGFVHASNSVRVTLLP